MSHKEFFVKLLNETFIILEYIKFGDVKYPLDIYFGDKEEEDLKILKECDDFLAVKRDIMDRIKIRDTAACRGFNITQRRCPRFLEIIEPDLEIIDFDNLSIDTENARRFRRRFSIF